MYEILKIKNIYNDFIGKVSLTDEQIKILKMLIDKKSIIQISMETGLSQRTLNREIKKIKTIYENYKKMELIKMLMFMD